MGRNLESEPTGISKSKDGSPVTNNKNWLNQWLNPKIHELGPEPTALEYRLAREPISGARGHHSRLQVSLTFLGRLLFSRNAESVHADAVQLWHATQQHSLRSRSATSSFLILAPSPNIMKPSVAIVRCHGCNKITQQAFGDVSTSAET